MVITSYHPVVGGAERQVAQVAGFLRDMGHEITVVTRHHAGLPLVEHHGAAKIVRVRAEGGKTVAALRFLAGAATAIAREKPDVVHCHSLHSPALAGLFGGLLAGGKPVVAKPMCSGEAFAIANKPLGGLRMRLFGTALSRLVSISAEITDELGVLGFAAARIVPVPNGVDCEVFRPDPHTPFATEFPAGIRFVFAGRFAAQKRLPLLLRAFRRIAGQAPDAVLMLAGANRSAGSDASVGGEDEADLGALLHHPQIHLLGRVSDMPGLFAASDVFVLPSASEGLSNALLEACAAGLPTISARIGGNVDVITDGETGLLFTADDEDDLARQLLRLASDSGLRTRLGAAARKRACDAFDIRVTAQRLDRLYRQVAANG